MRRCGLISFMRNTPYGWVKAMQFTGIAAANTGNYGADNTVIKKATVAGSPGSTKKNACIR
jgi:hypothetical protein